MTTRERLISRRRLVAGGGTVLFGMLCPLGGMRGTSAAASIPVSIANASGNVSLTMQEMIKQQGYLQEMGLAGTITNVADGSKITGGLIGGDVDVSTMAGFGQVFPAIERGAKLKIIAGACLLPLLALYSSKPGIKTLKDLEGRTVGTGALGALLHQLVVALLQKNGVDIAKVSFVNVGASGDVFRAASMGTVDAGTGELFGPKLGKLPDSFRAAGVTSESITDVLLTHIHPDHSGGLAVGENKIFPNATIHVNKKELEFWSDRSTREKYPEPTKTFFGQVAPTVGPYITSGQVKTFEGGIQIFRGIRSLPAYGHPPGHTYYALEDGARSSSSGETWRHHLGVADLTLRIGEQH